METHWTSCNLGGRHVLLSRIEFGLYPNFPYYALSKVSSIRDYVSVQYNFTFISLNHTPIQYKNCQFFFQESLIFVFMSVSPACIIIMCIQFLREVDEGIRSPWTRS